MYHQQQYTSLKILNAATSRIMHFMAMDYFICVTTFNRFVSRYSNTCIGIFRYADDQKLANKCIAFRKILNRVLSFSVPYDIYKKQKQSQLKCMMWILMVVNPFKTLTFGQNMIYFLTYINQLYNIRSLKNTRRRMQQKKMEKSLKGIPPLANEQNHTD